MRTHAHYLLLAIGALFLIGFVANLASGEATLGDSAIQLTIAAGGGLGFLFIRGQERSRRAFVAFLVANIDAVRAGTARYQDQPISYATRVRVYHTVLSFLVVTLKLPTGLVLHRSGRDLALRAGCSLVSLVFGWWGIPWGPIWTVQALAGNLRGTTEFSVGELLEGRTEIDLPRAVQRAPRGA